MAGCELFMVVLNRKTTQVPGALEVQDEPALSLVSGGWVSLRWLQAVLLKFNWHRSNFG